VNVSFPLQSKGGETARIAVISLLCLGLVVEKVFVILDGLRKKLRSAEAPELAYANAGHNTVPCVSLKRFRVDLDSCPAAARIGAENEGNRTWLAHSLNPQ
jgi:hypothetical protein